MAMVSCEQHGLSMSLHVCAHVWEALLSARNLVAAEVILTWGGEDFCSVYLCPSCVATLDVEAGQHCKIGDPVGERVFATADSPVCEHCFSRRDWG